MGLREAYLINLNNYEIKKVQEHHEEVIANPEVYGLSKKDIPKDINDNDARNAMLLKVMKNGWARVRMGINQLAFEGYDRWDDLIAGLIVFCNRINVPGHKMVYMSNLKTGRSMNDTVSNIINENIPEQYRGSKLSNRFLMALRGISKRSILRSAKCNDDILDKQTKLVLGIVKNYVGKEGINK